MITLIFLIFTLSFANLMRPSHFLEPAYPDRIYFAIAILIEYLMDHTDKDRTEWHNYAELLQKKFN